MAEEPYNLGTFLTELYSRLDDNGLPLGLRQRSVLEGLIAETFGVSRRPTIDVETVAEDPLASQLMDIDLLERVCVEGGHKEAMATRIQRAIYMYSMTNMYSLSRSSIRLIRLKNGTRDLTDAYALMFYQEGVERMGRVGNKEGYRHSFVERGFGIKSFKMLHAYLSARGLVEGDVPLPRYLRKNSNKA